MSFELKFKGITMRWLLYVYLPIALAVILLTTVFSLVYASFYEDRVKNLAEDYTLGFYALADCDRDNFETQAVSLTEDFQYKTLLEVQVLDHTGKVLISTTGFETAKDDMPDYKDALLSKKTGYFRGENSGGEDILAGTTMLYGDNGEALGAYRWITSMQAANDHIWNFVIILLLVCLGILVISALSGLYFIKSIVRPIRDVSNTARRIAMGEFESKMEIKKNDEIGELCDTINYMASELSQAEQLKNDFISSVSHELRTPLTAIRGWGETAKMSVGFDNDIVARGLDVILSEGERLSGLVEDLLDFSRMQSGRLTVNTQPIDISGMLTTAVDMYTELAKKQGIEVSFTPPSTPSVVMGDPDRLKQVFVNIIDNAVKYTEKGGLVLVVQTREEACVRIVVKDTGVGIPAQDLDHVKEKFFKSNKTVRGSGIGLAVADEIIKQHQGLLFIESTEGAGTTVTIVLPLYEDNGDNTEEEDALPITDFETPAQKPQTEDEAEGDENGDPAQPDSTKKENDNGEGES